MQSSDLTRDQLLAMVCTLTRHRDYLGRLMRRMEQLSFPSGDPVYTAVRRAWEGTSGLVVEVTTRANDGVMRRRPGVGFKE